MTIRPDFRGLSAYFEGVQSDQEDLIRSTVRSVFTSILWENGTDNDEMMSLFGSIQHWRQSGNLTLKKAYKLFFKELIGKVIQDDGKCHDLANKWRLLVEEYSADLQDEKLMTKIIELVSDCKSPSSFDLRQTNRNFYNQTLNPSPIPKVNADLLTFLTEVVEEVESDVKRIPDNKSLQRLFARFLDAAIEGLSKKFRNHPATVLVGPRKKTERAHRHFLESREQQVEEIASLVRSNQTLDTVLNSTCAWRSRYALLQLEVEWADFGKKREEELLSPPHSANSEHLVLKSEQWVGTSTENFDSIGASIETQDQQRTLKENKGASEFSLTRLLVTRELQELPWEPKSPYFEEFLDCHTEYCSWPHTSPENIERAMDHVKKLYDKIATENVPERVLDSLARMHWWFRRACPYRRGNTAIMGAVAEGILRAKGISLKPTTLIDIEALTESSEDAFASRYRSFFNVSSTWITPPDNKK